MNACVAGERERERLEAHLSSVERALRDRPTGQLTPSQRLSRAAHLDVLAAYWRAGRFPHNHDMPGRIPCFIDEHGGRCAVAELLVCDGREPLAQRIATRMKNHYLSDMVDPELAAWVLGSGLELDELAWIQPTYGFEQPRPPPAIECAEPCSKQCVESAPPVYEWDGHKLVPVASMAAKMVPRAELRDLAVAPNGTIWATTFNGLTRWSGREWEMIALDQARYAYVWAPANDEVWSFGSGLRRIRKGPNGWSQTVFDPNGKLRHGAWGTPDDLWFAGCNDVLHIRDGVARQLEIPELPMLGKHDPQHAKFCSRTVSGTGPSDVWFVGTPAVPVHWDGASFQQIDLRGELSRTQDTDSGVLQAVWASGEGEVWFGGLTTLARWKEGTLRRFTHVLVDSISGTGPSDVWAVGGGGVLHWDGTRWGRVHTGARFAKVIDAGKGRLLFLTDYERSCLRFQEDRLCVERRAAACKRVNGTPPKPTLTPDEPTGAVTALMDIPAPLASLGAPASDQELPVDLGPARAPAVERIVEKTGKTDETPAPPPPRRPGMWLGLLVAASGLASLLGLLLWLRSRRTQ